MCCLELTELHGKKQIIFTLTAVSVVILAILLITISNGKKSDRTPATSTTIAMGTVINQSVYAPSETQADSSISEINKIINNLDTKYLSWRIQGTDVYKVNENGSAKVDDITSNCIKTCIALSSKCNGLFDITVGNLSTLWNIGTEDARVPSDEEIQSALKFVDYTSVRVDNDRISVSENQKLDLGAVGKGLACDEIRDYLKSTDVEGAAVSVGGSVLLYGTNPSSKDGAFNVAIRNPFGSANDFIALIHTKSACISTSGDYEKVFIADGKTYHHILNPKTGYPAESNVTGVTVVSESGVLSDALSTACFILGYGDESLALLKAYNAEAVFVTKDKKIYITDNLKSQFTLVDESYKIS